MQGGIVPVSPPPPTLLLSSHRPVRELREQRLEGIVPVNTLVVNCNIVKLGMLPKLAGIDPDNLFEPTKNICKDGILPTEFEIVPLN
jgi:hypothetical protein